MKLTRRLLCLIMTVIFSLAHIPVTAFAADKTVKKEPKTNSSDFRFETSEKTFDTIGEEYSLDRDLICGIDADFILFSCKDGDGVIEVDEGGTLKVIGEGTATVVATAEDSSGNEGGGTASSSETKKASPSEATPSAIQPYRATMKIIVELNNSGGGGSSGGGSSGGGGGGFSGGHGSLEANAGTRQAGSGAIVTTNYSYLGNGIKLITASITLGGKTIIAQEKVTPLPDGSSQRLYSINGDLSGLVFANAGIVSDDGSTFTTKDGTKYAITNAMKCIITKTDGTTVGCFLDPATGNPIATGADAVFVQLGIDGEMYAHYINPQGYFYTGQVVMNGMMINFNEEGVMLSYSAIGTAS